MELLQIVRPEIRSLPVYEPGKPAELLARESGLDPVSIVKLASNENPLGASPAVLHAIRNHLPNLALYPDNSGYHLVNALAARHNVTAEHILLAAGSNEIFYLLCDVFAGPGTEVVLGEFSFASYRIAALMAGAKVVSVPMPELAHDLDAMLAAVTPETRLVFLPNPNNPTGTCLPVVEVEAFAKALPPHVIFCYDAAYAEYEDEVLDSSSLRSAGVNIVEARTFSKIFGLAGLRIGYSLAAPELTALINRARAPFNTNSVAQCAALAALSDSDWVSKSREANCTGRKQLLSGLGQLGQDAFGEHANFILFRRQDATAFASAMQKCGVITRHLHGYGLPHLIRVSIGTFAENERFLKTVESLLCSTCE